MEAQQARWMRERTPKVVYTSLRTTRDSLADVDRALLRQAQNDVAAFRRQASPRVVLKSKPDVPNPCVDRARPVTVAESNNGRFVVSRPPTRADGTAAVAPSTKPFPDKCVLPPVAQTHALRELVPGLARTLATALQSSFWTENPYVLVEELRNNLARHDAAPEILERHAESPLSLVPTSKPARDSINRLLHAQVQQELAKARISRRTTGRVDMVEDAALLDYSFATHPASSRLPTLDQRVLEMLGMRRDRVPRLVHHNPNNILTPLQRQIRQRWRDTMQAVITLVKIDKQLSAEQSKKGNTADIALGAKERKAFVKERATAQSGLSSILKQAKYSYIVNVAKEVREFFTAPQDEILADYDHIEQLLNVLPAFARMDPDTKKLLVRVMELEVHPANKVVLKQGHDPTSFYFILTGQCEVYKRQVENGGEVVIPLNVMNPGDAFGEYAIISSSKRTAYVATTMRTELLRVDKEDYLAARTSEYKYMIFKSFAFIRDNPTISDTDLFRVLRFTDQCKHAANSVLATEGSPCNDVFFVKSGMCNVVKAVPFVQHREAAARDSQRQISRLSKYSPGMALGPGDRVVYKLLHIRTLQAGDYFPGMDLCFDVAPGEMSLPGSARSPLSKIVALAEAASARTEWSSQSADSLSAFNTHLNEKLQKEQVSYVSVIAVTDVELFKTSRVEFGRILTPDTVLYMAENNEAYLYPMVPELQQEYLNQRHWEQLCERMV